MTAVGELQPDGFDRLLAAARSQDPDAIAQLLQLLEPHVLRVIRFRFRSLRLRRVVDSVDLAQSVLANFFVRFSQGQFDLPSRAELLALIGRMAQNRVVTEVEYQTAQRRDARRVDSGASKLSQLVCCQPTPASIVERRELIQMVHDRLSPEEREIAEHRVAGETWEAIAERLERSPDAIRKQFTRAMDRVTEELGFAPSTLATDPA